MEIAEIGDYDLGDDYREMVWPKRIDVILTHAIYQNEGHYD